MTDGTLLYRQISPSFIQEGRVTSATFKPTLKDRKRLSVYDGDQISAEGSWKYYTVTLGLKSVGVRAVTVSECKTQVLAVELDGVPCPYHASVVFENLSNSQVEKKAKRLKEAADARGWQYQAEPE